MGCMDDSWFTRPAYLRQPSLVIADGAHVTHAGSVDYKRLIHKLCECEEGPLVSKRGERNCLGWYWVDSTETLPNLDSEVKKHFDLLGYDSVNGRQSGKVDSKIQALINKNIRTSRNSYAPLVIVLLSGDGDHADTLYRNIRKSTSREEPLIRIWICAWKYQLSRKLEALPASIIDIEEFASGPSIPLNTILATPFSHDLQAAVDAVLPEYKKLGTTINNKVVPELLCNPGLQKMISDIVEKNVSVSIVNGRTGCGKSTQVPQIFYDLQCYEKLMKSKVNGVIARRPRVIVAEPRRIACRELYSRTQFERECKDFDWKLSGEAEVGYHISGDAHCTATTPIVFCTAGVLVKQLIHNEEEAWDVIVLDEVHEMTVEYEMLLSLLCSPEYLTTGKKLVIMSATLDGMCDELQDYVIKRCGASPDCVARYDLTPTTNPWPARAFSEYRSTHKENFNVATYTLSDIRKRQEMMAAQRATEEWLGMRCYFDSELCSVRDDFCYSLIVELIEAAKREDRNEVVLVFLPAWDLLSDWSIELKKQLDVDVSVLHSRIPVEKHEAAMRCTARRRVILANNIAESSITIENATVVVDRCLQKAPVLRNNDEPHKKLDYCFATKDAIIQRAGRVGRTSPGTCYRMLTDYEWKGGLMKTFKTPNMKTDALEDTVLNVYNRCDGRDNLPFTPIDILEACLNSPTREDINNTIEKLVRLEALRKENGRYVLTPTGRLISRLPFDVSSAVFVIKACSADHTMGKAAVIFAVLQTIPFYDAYTIRQSLDTGKFKSQHCRSFKSDVVACTEVLTAYCKNPERAHYMLDIKALEDGLRKICHARHELHRFRPLCPSLPEEVLGSNKVTSTKLMNSIKKEIGEMKITDYDYVLLMLLHAAVNKEKRLQQTSTYNQTEDGRGERSLWIHIPTKSRSKQHIDISTMKAYLNNADVGDIHVKTNNTGYRINVIVREDELAGHVRDDTVRNELGIGERNLKLNCVTKQARYKISDCNALLENNSVCSPAHFSSSWNVFASSVTKHGSKKGNHTAICTGINALLPVSPNRGPARGTSLTSIMDYIVLNAAELPAVGTYYSRVLTNLKDSFIERLNAAYDIPSDGCDDIDQDGEAVYSFEPARRIERNEGCLKDQLTGLFAEIFDIEFQAIVEHLPERFRSETASFF